MIKKRAKFVSSVAQFIDLEHREREGEKEARHGVLQTQAVESYSLFLGDLEETRDAPRCTPHTAFLFFFQRWAFDRYVRYVFFYQLTFNWS